VTALPTINLERPPWVDGSPAAHGEFAIRWDDSVPASDPPHAGHTDRIVVVDDADRTVLEGWVTTAATPDGGGPDLHHLRLHRPLTGGPFVAVA
jgi:hypothetical protein